MSLNEREYQAVFTYLRSLNFHFLDAWVKQCMDYCKSRDPSLSLEAIKDVVREQWLLLNLRNIRVPCLPPNLASCDKTILTGKYMVQVETMIDSSRSCYSQFQEILNVNFEEIEANEEIERSNDWKIKPNRCLVFTISDGVQELKAMEYKPILKIKTNDPELLPGFKMLIIGPVECRKGMVMLQEQNIKIYGGEVDTLTVSNNLKSLLIRKLDLNEEDFQSNILPHNNAQDINTSQNVLDVNTIDHSIVPSNSQSTNIETLLSHNDDIFFGIHLESDSLSEANNGFSANIPHTSKTCDSSINERRLTETENILSNINFDDLSTVNGFDDKFVPISGKHLLPSEEIIIPSSKKISLSPTMESSEPILKDIGQKTKPKIKNRNKIDNVSIEESHMKRNSLKNNRLTKPSESICTDLTNFFTIDTSKPGNLITERLQKTAVDKFKQTICVSHSPFVYLKQIMSKTLEKVSVYTIKGTILTLKKKIIIEKDEYKLRGTITDGSLSIDADFASNIIESLLEYSPCEIQTMMKAKHLNAAVGDRIKEAFKKAQEKFISLNCLMKTKFFPDGKTPVILSLEELTVYHLNALKTRCE